MEYYVFVSNDCNLNCSYCSILIDSAKYDIPLEPNYNVENLKEFISRMQEYHNDEYADIIFFGGEPTLNFNFIEMVIVLFQQIDKYTIRYMLHTNGLLLNEVPKKILQHLNAIMVSINYSCLPKCNLFDGYFNKIVCNIKYIKSHKNIPIIGRLTITEDTSLYISVMTLHPFFDYIYWQIENCYHFKNFDVFFNSYSYDLKLLIDIWSDYLKYGIVLKLVPFTSCLNFIIKNKTPVVFACGYNRSMIYIQTNGKCYTCVEDMLTEKNYIGSISSIVEFDTFSLKNTGCNSCEFINICQGRCGRMHKEFSNTHILEYCKLNKVMFSYFRENKEKYISLLTNKSLTLDTDNFILDYTEFIP